MSDALMGLFAEALQPTEPYTSCPFCRDALRRARLRAAESLCSARVEEAALSRGVALPGPVVASAALVLGGVWLELTCDEVRRKYLLGLGRLTLEVGLSDGIESFVTALAESAALATPVKE